MKILVRCVKEDLQKLKRFLKDTITVKKIKGKLNSIYI